MSGRSPGEGNRNLFQNSCLGNPINRGAWWAIVHEVTRVRHYFTAKQQHVDGRKRGGAGSIDGVMSEVPEMGKGHLKQHKDLKW